MFEIPSKMSLFDGGEHSNRAGKNTRFRFKNSEDVLLLETLIPLVQEEISSTTTEFWHSILKILRSECERFKLCSERTLNDHTQNLIKSHQEFRSKELTSSGKEYTLTPKCKLMDTLMQSWNNYEDLAMRERELKKNTKRTIVNDIATAWDRAASRIRIAVHEDMPSTDEGININQDDSAFTPSDTTETSEVPPRKKMKSSESIMRRNEANGDVGLEYLREKLATDTHIEEKRLELESKRLELQERQMAYQEKQLLIDEKKWEKQVQLDEKKLEIEERKWEMKQKTKQAQLQQQEAMAQFVMKMAEKMNFSQ